MKIKKVNNTDFLIYLYDEDDSYDNVKDIIKRVQKKLKLQGFYKVIVITKKIGLFIKLIKLDNSFYKDTLDLKIENKDEDVYFETSDYFIISDSPKIIFLEGLYYGLVDNYFDKTLEKVEFGSFILESDMNDIFNRGIII